MTPTPKRPRRRRCPRCDVLTHAPDCCGILLANARRWRMTPERIRAVQLLRVRKGLDEETYRLRLGAVGVSTCKALTRAAFRRFVAGLQSLPDSPTWLARGRGRGRA